jgi:acylglycerol lipase
MTAPLYTEAWLSGFDGHQFYTRTWAAADAKAVMLYVHGFADHIARYDHVHVRWPERGFTLFAYDMRGFGRTALDQANRSPDEQYGKTSRAIEVQDLEWWITYLAKEYPGLPLFLVGYSAVGFSFSHGCSQADCCANVGWRLSAGIPDA